MLLSVQDLTVSIGGQLPLAGLSFDIARGEILGLVGESGSGKSLTAMAVMGLLPLMGGRVLSGSLRFDGTDLAGLPEPMLRNYRGKRIALVPQNPMTALDPLCRVGAQVDIMARIHLGQGRKAARARTIDLFTRLRIPEPAVVCEAYPHQLSGGMRQRVVLAMALAGEPDLIIADEPTTALDVTIQAQIVHMLEELTRESGLSLLLITHDMGVVAQICDRVAVLYAGHLAETRAVGPLFATPKHPYTAALIQSIPTDDRAPGSLTGIPGAVPAANGFPSGCRFHPRCPRASALCAEVQPVPQVFSDGGAVACHHPLEGAHG